MTKCPLKSENVDLSDFKKDMQLNPHQYRRLEMIKRLIEPITHKGTALDYGCGYGDIAYNLRNYFDDITGVDVSSERVAWANKEFSPNNYFVCGERSLDFPEASFNTVLSVVVINWVDDISQYLDNINRVLVDKGNLVIAVRNIDKIQILARRLLMKQPPKDLDYFTLGSFTNLLVQKKFKIEKIDCFYEHPAEFFPVCKETILEFSRIPMRLLNLPGCSPYFGIRAIKNK